MPLPDPSQIPHLSASSIADFIRCSASWYLSRIAKIPRPPVSVMEVGTAIHKALSAHHESGDPELALLAAWKNMAVPAPTGSLERALEAIKAYRDAMPSQSIDVAAWRFSFPVPGLPVPIVGEFDLVRCDAQDPTHGFIVDWKTGGGRSWTQTKADSEIQPTIYIMAYRHEAAYFPEKFVYWILQTSSGSSHSVRSIETTRSQDDIEVMTETAINVYHRMLTETPTATCPRGWCRYPEQCAKLKGERGWP